MTYTTYPALYELAPIGVDKAPVAIGTLWFCSTICRSAYRFSYPNSTYGEGDDVLDMDDLVCTLCGARLEVERTPMKKYAVARSAFRLNWSGAAVTSVDNRVRLSFLDARSEVEAEGYGYRHIREEAPETEGFGDYIVVVKEVKP
jgi:hypothetical protein